MSFKNWKKEAKLELLKNLLDEYEQDLIDENEKEKEFKVKKLSDFADKAEDEIANPDKKYGISTGYNSLDKYLDGLGKGELIVLAGATSCGKTQLVQCILLNLALKYAIPTAFLSFEMPPVEIYKRFRAMMMSKNINTSPDVTKQLPICLDEGVVNTLEGLEQYILEAKKQENIQLLAIDHLQFFIKSGENQANEVGRITRGLKSIAIKHEIPILLISHIRKLNHKNVPNLDDLKDSSSIGQDADTVMMIWRNQFEGEAERVSSNTEKNRFVLCKIRKNRRKGFLQNVYFKSDDNFYLNEISMLAFKVGAEC